MAVRGGTARDTEVNLASTSLPDILATYSVAAASAVLITVVLPPTIRLVPALRYGNARCPCSPPLFQTDRIGIISAPARPTLHRDRGARTRGPPMVPHVDLRSGCRPSPRQSTLDDRRSERESSAPALLRVAAATFSVLSDSSFPATPLGTTLNYLAVVSTTSLPMRCWPMTFASRVLDGRAIRTVRSRPHTEYGRSARWRCGGLHASASRIRVLRRLRTHHRDWRGARCNWIKAPSSSLASGHPCHAQLNDGMLRFDFNGIMLPDDSGSDEGEQPWVGDVRMRPHGTAATRRRGDHERRADHFRLSTSRWPNGRWVLPSTRSVGCAGGRSLALRCVRIPRWKELTLYLACPLALRLRRWRCDRREREGHASEALVRPAGAITLRVHQL